MFVLNNLLVIVAAMCVLSALVNADTPLATPNPIHEAAKYTKLLRQVANGTLYEVTAPDTAPLKVMHVYGTAYERGVAHGQLLSAEIIEFITVDLIAYYKSEVASLPIDTLPKWLQAFIEKLEPDLEKNAPAVFEAALGTLNIIFTFI